MVTFGSRPRILMPLENDPYDPFGWMVVEQSLEEELTVERTVREIDDCDDFDAVKGVCTALVRQNWHQAKLLQQAVGRIALMDYEETFLE